MRLYKAPSVTRPWHPHRTGGVPETCGSSECLLDLPGVEHRVFVCPLTLVVLLFPQFTDSSKELVHLQCPPRQHLARRLLLMDVALAAAQ